ncbi:MAG: NAD(P)-binding domain-containing protein [Ignavibacteria bacterium]|nr:NAD(P)-binding domain-containing protein [Ignavibacteria bacterium]
MIKKKLYNIISKLYKPVFKDGRKNILIETSPYFTRTKWERFLKDKNILDKFNVFYSAGRFEIYRIISNADAYFTFGLNPYYDLSNLKMIYFATSDEFRIERDDLKIYSSKGISGIAIAEYCLGMSFCLLYGYKNIFRNGVNHDWKQPVFRKFDETGISGKVIGIIGLGNNGKSISNIFRKNNCRVIGTDTDKSKHSIVDVFYDEIGDVLSKSDIIILSMNAGEGTKDLINLSRLSRMKKEGFLINVSRGSVINENDLYKALKRGIIAGAALDVLQDEPLSPFNKLWKLNNLIITPHIAGNINMFTDEIIADFTEKLKSGF